MQEDLSNMPIPYNPYFSTFLNQLPTGYNTDQPDLYTSQDNILDTYKSTAGYNKMQSDLSNILGSKLEAPMDIKNPNVNLSTAAASKFSPGAAIGGVVGLATDLSGIANQRLNLGDPMAVYQQGVDPTYQTGEYFSNAFSSVPQKTTGMEVGGTALKTALAAGQATGFNPIAMGVGALVGGVGAAIAGNRRRVKQSRERRTALNKALAEQQRFNTAQENYNQEQMAMQDYQRRSNPYTRMSNLYSI